MITTVFVGCYKCADNNRVLHDGSFYSICLAKGFVYKSWNSNCINTFLNSDSSLIEVGLGYVGDRGDWFKG